MWSSMLWLCMVWYLPRRLLVTPLRADTPQGLARALGRGLGAPVPVGGLLSWLCGFSTCGLTWPLVCRLPHLYVPISDE